MRKREKKTAINFGILLIEQKISITQLKKCVQIHTHAHTYVNNPLVSMYICE